MRIVRDNDDIDWNKKQLWEGCIFASITHAIMVAHCPYVSHEQSWDGINYTIQNGSGSVAAITFHPLGCVAVFLEVSSERSFGEKRNELKLEDYFKKSPKEIFKIANEECLQYMLDEIDNEIRPIISTCIWEENGVFHSIDPLDIFLEEGGELLYPHSLSIEESKEIWMEEFEMTEEQYELILSIFNRRITDPTEKIILTPDEIEIIGSDDEFGIQESKVCCEQIGIFWE